MSADLDFEAPFRERGRMLWLPPGMTTPPFLDPALPAPPIQRRLALLINPF